MKMLDQVGDVVNNKLKADKTFDRKKLTDERKRAEKKINR